MQDLLKTKAKQAKKPQTPNHSWLFRLPGIQLLIKQTIKVPSGRKLVEIVFKSSALNFTVTETEADYLPLGKTQSIFWTLAFQLV